MQYWILKTEPETFSMEDLMSKKKEMWDGVRNYQARNNLNEMQMGDLCLIYHSGKERGIVGSAKVVKTAYPDPTTDSDKWVCVDIAPVKKLNFYSLETIKENKDLQQIGLLKQSRLSVVPIDEVHFKILSGETIDL
jgi:predicted RNA-binding protein with PUA-like domain